MGSWSNADQSELDEMVALVGSPRLSQFRPYLARTFDELPLRRDFFINEFYVTVLMSGLRACVMAALLMPGVAEAGPRPVATEQDAIKAGIAACDSSWGREGRRQHMLTGHISGDDWHAVLDGDHWTVWRGARPNSAYQIDIPKDGAPVDGDLTCIAQMGWGPSEGPNRMVLGKADDAGR